MADFGLTVLTYTDQFTLSELGVFVPALFPGQLNHPYLRAVCGGHGGYTRGIGPNVLAFAGPKKGKRET